MSGNRAFQQVLSEKEARSYLREGAKTHASVLIWTKAQGQVVNTHLTLYDGEQGVLQAWIPNTVNPLTFAEEVQGKSGNSCYFSISLSRANIFFRADFVGWSQSEFSFRVPEKIFKVQRRQFTRVDVPEEIKFWCEMDDPVVPGMRIARKVLDVSAGGMALIVLPDEELVFTTGLVLKNLKFSLGGKPIRCDAEIRHVKEVKPGPYTPSFLKVGIMFRNLSQEDVTRMAVLILEEARKQFEDQE